MPLQLVPAVELLLINSSKETRPPLFDGRETPRELVAWREALFRSVGLKPVESVSAGSAMIPVPAILSRADILSAIVEEHLLQIPFETLPSGNVLDIYEGVGTFSGGLAVVREGKLLLQPQCCCDLNNICDWAEAMTYRGIDEGEFLWTGHPYLYKWFRNGKLVLQLESDPSIHFAVRPKEIRDALQTAVALQRELSTALEPVLAAHFGSASKLVCDSLAGLLQFDHPVVFTDNESAEP